MLGYRIAVASKDGKVVTDHFGHCRKFSVIEVEDGQYHFIGFREVIPPCGGGEQDWLISVPVVGGERQSRRREVDIRIAG